MGLSLLMKYVIVTVTVIALWCTVQFLTADVMRSSTNRSFYYRDVDEFTHQWMEERGYSEDGGKVENHKENESVSDNVTNCNDIKAPSTRFIIFNVLPKSGSRTLYSLAINVAGRQHGVDIQNTMSLTNETKSERIERLLRNDSATFVYSHLPYVNFNSTDSSKKIVYISIVRDPIERLVSLYYYKRYGDSTAPGYFREKMDRLNLSRDTFDECVERNGDCINSNLMQKTISHFCGMDSENSLGTQTYCMSEARTNIKNRYLVVGVMEDYVGFIKVLERLLPDVFQGAEEFYQEFITKTYFKVMKTKNKTGPSVKVVRELKKRMSKEYEFYDYVKKEFEILKNKLGID